MVAEKDIDMIIMGTNGIRNTKGISFGSNTVAMMEKITSCPVLAVPQEAEFTGLKEIIFPASYETAHKKNEIIPLLDLAREFKSNIKILHIGENEELTETQVKNRKLLEDNLTGEKYTFHSLVDMTPSVGISGFAERRHTNLIALISRKHSFLRRLINTPVIKGISFYSKIPIMVMHIQND